MKKTFLILSLLAALFVTGCKKEVVGSAVCPGMGRIDIVLSAEDVVFVSDRTKATSEGQSLNDITLTISGQTALGETVNGQPLELSQKENTAFCYFMAGTYRITATYTPEVTDNGTGELCYSGTSEEFTVETGKTTGAVEIQMTPSNSRVKVIFDSSLKEFYSTVSVAFTHPREVSVSSSDSDAQGCITIYLPAGAAGVYGISALPLSNSGSASMGITGLRLPTLKDGAKPLMLEAGKEYTIRVKFAPGGIAVFLDGENTPAYTTEETWDGLFS